MNINPSVDNKANPILAYAATGTLILGPTLQPGYLLTLDMIFTPQMHVPLSPDSLMLFHALEKMINLVSDGSTVEKVILLLIFALAGIGVHRLIPAKYLSARYGAALLYVINPFTYSRLMAGQYLVLAGYALFPWFIFSLTKFCRKPTRATAIKLSAWSAIIGFVSLHYLGFAALSAIIALVIVAAQRRHDPKAVRSLTIWSAFVALCLLVINSFWLIPTLLGHSSQSRLITSFTDRYFLSFRTSADPHLGQVLNTLGLYGFWGDDQHMYLSPKSSVPYWWFIALLVWLIAIAGAIFKWRENRFSITLVLILGGVGLVLAQGIMGSPFAGIDYWLMQHVWPYRAYREPAKFVGLIALALCYLFGLGADWLLERARKLDWSRGALAGLLIVLPIAYTPTMVWGASGQLHAVDYPKDWYALNSQLDHEHSHGKLLFLPWHQYMYFDFAGRTIANPASRFFDRPVIQGDNAEIGLIEYQSQSPVSRTIETQIISPATGQTDLGPRLHALGVEYVVLAKEADYQNYNWLGRSSGLKMTSDTKTLLVYKVLP